MDEIEIEARESGWQRWGVRLLPAVTFVVGLGLGTVLVLAGGSGENAVAEAAPSAATSGPAVANPDTVVTLPGACADAAEQIREATGLLDDTVAAVRDFDPDTLVGLINRLEDLDATIRPLSAECSQVGVSASAQPSPQPSPSP